MATAKAVWQERKAALKNAGADETTLKNDAVRYALVEIVNLYDEGLTFEPIHRVLFEADAAELTTFLAARLGGTFSKMNSAEELENTVKNSTADFGFVYTENGKTEYALLSTDSTELAVSRFQPAADDFIRSHTSVTIDYIHGGKENAALGKKAEAVGILLPPIAKDSFFATIARTGALPRKSFSMGEADEKRFYLECRKLFR